MYSTPPPHETEHRVATTNLNLYHIPISDFTSTSTTAPFHHHPSMSSKSSADRTEGYACLPPLLTINSPLSPSRGLFDEKREGEASLVSIKHVGVAELHTPVNPYAPRRFTLTDTYAPYQLEPRNQPPARSHTPRDLFRRSTKRLKRAYTLLTWGKSSEGSEPVLDRPESTHPDVEKDLYGVEKLLPNDLYEAHEYHEAHEFPPNDNLYDDQETASDGPYKPLSPADTPSDPFLISYPPSDPRHPYKWSSVRKYVILGVMCSAAVCVTVSSSIQASTYTQLMAQFGVSRTEAVAGVSLYVLGFGIGAREW